MSLAKSSSASDLTSRADPCSGVRSRSAWQIGFDQRTPVPVSVISIGSETAKILQQCKYGCVLAVFDRSFYVQCAQHVFCIGVVTIGPGPLHMLIASEREGLPLTLASGVSMGVSINLDVCSPQDPQRVSTLCDALSEENHHWLYSGKVSGAPVASEAVPVVIEALKRMVTPPEQTGFGWILASSDLQYQECAWLASRTGDGVTMATLARYAHPALLNLKGWLENVLQACVKDSEYPIPQVQTLLGAGPGLTPSGDDLLAGIMLALHRVQRADLAESLWQELEPHLQHGTNVISGAHLRMAAIGQCSEQVLSLLACVFGNTVLNSAVLDEEVLDEAVLNHNVSIENPCFNAADVQSTATKIQLQANAIGASSGWDMLAGMTLVLRAL